MSTFYPIGLPEQEKHELHAEYERLRGQYYALAESPFSSKGLDDLRVVVKRMEEIALVLRLPLVEPRKQN
ncbi:MAG: hypothetical protein ACRD5G_16830 [Candidatus Acidiferrales bacterium]